LFGERAIGKLHEGEATWTPGLAIDRHDHVGWFSDRREMGPEVRLRRAVGQVADEQTDSQGFLVKAYRFYLSRSIGAARLATTSSWVMRQQRSKATAKP
jgi:hypothetical protein